MQKYAFFLNVANYSCICFALYPLIRTFASSNLINNENENVVLDARYNWGLLKVENIGSAYYNRVFEVTLGYKFELDF